MVDKGEKKERKREKERRERKEGRKKGDEGGGKEGRKEIYLDYFIFLGQHSITNSKVCAFFTMSLNVDVCNTS